jgi:hypothetical protein
VIHICNLKFKYLEKQRFVFHIIINVTVKFNCYLMYSYLRIITDTTYFSTKW